MFSCNVDNNLLVAGISQVSRLEAPTEQIISFTELRAKFSQQLTMTQAEDEGSEMPDEAIFPVFLPHMLVLLQLLFYDTFVVDVYYSYWVYERVLHIYTNMCLGVWASFIK